jgi:hypothetical protein
MENKEMFYKANVRLFYRIKKQFSDKYPMRRIKTFGNISESASDTPVYRSRLASYRKNDRPTQVDTYDEPQSLYMANVIDGTAEWTLDLQHFKYGIEIGSEGARLKSLTLTIEKEDEYTGDMEEDTIELKEEDINHETLKYEVNQFPLDLDAIEIDMNKSEDPKEWIITLKIGRISDY